MKEQRFLMMLIVVLLLTSTLSAQVMATYYAAPNGNGSDCTLGAPCSLTGARNKVRTVNAAMSGNIIVNLLPGTYIRNTTFVLNEQDSGSNGYHVIYKASNTTDFPIISGAQQISGWTLHDADRNIYKASASGNVFRQIYVNDNLATRARTPSTFDTERLGPYYRGGLDVDPNNNTIKIPSSEIDNWQNLDEVEMVIQPHWFHLRLRIGSFIKNGKTATIFPREPERTGGLNKNPTFYDNASYYFENAYEFLDAEGEWYLNRTEDMVYYKPIRTENMASANVSVPSSLETLMNISGSLGSPVHHVQLQNIRFEYTNWLLPNEKGTTMTQGTLIASGLRNAQGDPYPPGALKFEFANNIKLERNVFSKIGGTGVELNRGVNNSEIIGNVLYDIAGNGLILDTNFVKNPSSDVQLRDIVVENNVFTRVGRHYSNAQAILASFVKGITIEHNEIFDNPYTGMQIGQQTGGNIDVGMENNIIRYNKIYNTLREHDDGGAIYTLGRQIGTLIFENWVYNTKRSLWAGNFPVAAIYLDNYSEFITVERNVLGNNTINIYEQTGIGAKNNTFIANGINEQSVKDNAGLEPSYDLIKFQVQPLPSINPPIFMDMRVEAEDMQLSAATIESSSAYSNGFGAKPIPLGGNTGEVSFTFSGATGLYDIEVGYLREDDGQAEHGLYVDGQLIDSWTAALSSSTVELASRVVANVQVDNGDVVKITGKVTGGSHGRLDYLELVAVATGSSKVEAEDMQLSGATVENSSAYSNGSGAKPSAPVGSTGEASFTYNGTSGLYDIEVSYLREDDGQAEHGLYVDGQLIDSWTAALSSSTVELASRVVANVQVDNGDVVKITGKVTGGSHGRLDYLELVAVASGSSKVEAEDMQLSGATVENSSAYSNGSGAKPSAPVGSTGEASFTYNGTSGLYDIEVSYLREDDGQAEHGLYVDGQLIDSWTAALSSSTVELASRVVANVQVDNGDVVKITGKVNGGSHGRLDYVELVPISITSAKARINENIEQELGFKKPIVYPNPTNDVVKISFFLEKESNVNIKIYDTVGNILNDINQYSFSGNNEIEIRLDKDIKLQNTNLLIYEIKSDEFSNVGKIIVK